MDSLQEKNKGLVEKYPFLLPAHDDNGNPVKDYDYTYTWLDFMPEGWRKAFGEQMCEEILQALQEDNCLDEYEVVEVKEKFGFLHWYDFGGTDKVYKVIDRYEVISARTCVMCGAPATKLSRGWICPYCDSCAAGINDTFQDIQQTRSESEENV